MAEHKVLLVEDDDTLLRVLKYNLGKEGYHVVSASDGAQALDVARKERPELIVLDVMLPKLGGLEVCRILRQEMTEPILMLTAKTEEIDKVVGLELGADDYMTKPFSMRELLARVKAMLRRSEMMKQPVAVEQQPSDVVQAGKLRIDLVRHEAKLGAVALELSPKEFDLLSFLARAPGRVFARDELLNKVWGYDFAGDGRTVDVHVSWLRRKIEDDPTKPRRLVTVRGVGYKLEV